MSEEKAPRQSEIPVAGVFLLFIGVVLLLQTLGVLPWKLWNTLWRFWPAILIITGLGILLRRLNVWLVSLVLLAILFACLGLAIWQQDRPLPPKRGNTSNATSALFISLEPTPKGSSGPSA